MSVWENLQGLKGLNVVNLFAGMEVGRLACERAGIPIDKYYSSEIDKYAIQVSKANWPDIIHLGDVTKVYGCTLPDIHLLLGGSPCQGFSFAGKQLNFNDPRSALLFEYVRILKELREYNPGVYFLLENVNMLEKWQNIITELLGVSPIRLNSCLLSAQMRDRLYWTNIPFLGFPVDKKIVFKDIIDVNEKNYNFLTDKATDRALNNKRSRIVNFNTEKIPPILFNQGKQATDSVSIKTISGKVRWLTRNEVERLQNVPDNYTKSVGECAAISLLGNGWTTDVIANLLLPLGDYSCLF